MTTRMLINATAPGELRIAIVEDGELIELDIEATEKSSIRGNIYKGLVHNVEGSLEAAFINIGSRKQGFLPFSEVQPSQYCRKWTSKEHPRINDVVRRGQEIVVQVAKDAIGDKGATLTTHLSIPGRYSVLMPGSEAGGISRKIEDDKVRKRIRAMAAKLDKPENCGFIVRTAGLGQTKAAIQKDLNNLAEVHAKLTESAKMARAPSIIYSEPDLVARTLRDYFTEEIDEVLIDNREEYEAAAEYFQQLMPEYADRVQHYQNPIPIFAYHHVEEQIEATFERRVSLPSGGSIVIDETEALVAVDVNSGKMTSEGDHEGTVFKTNCEAAEETARQLKLRDLGGIVVVDFIDMELTKNKRAVEKVLSEASKEDKARFKISRINSKGLCVLTRQRIRQGMRKAFQRRCEVCDGTGWRRTAESHSLALRRRVETRLAQGGVGEVRVVTHRDPAEYMVNVRRHELAALEKEHDCRIVVVARPEMDRNADEVTYLSKGEVLAEITDQLPPREERKRGRRKKKRKKMEALAPEAESNARSKKKKRKGKKSEDAPIEIEAKGDTTFTGRPPPEMLAKLRAERKARLAARKGNGVESSAEAAEVSAEVAASNGTDNSIEAPAENGAAVKAAEAKPVEANGAETNVAEANGAEVVEAKSSKTRSKKKASTRKTRATRTSKARTKKASAEEDAPEAKEAPKKKASKASSEGKAAEAKPADAAPPSARVKKHLSAEEGGSASSKAGAKDTKRSLFDRIFGSR